MRGGKKHSQSPGLKQNVLEELTGRILPQNLGLYNMYVCVCVYNDVTSVSQSSQDSADVYVIVLCWPCQPSRMFTVHLRPREESRLYFFGP